MSLTSEQVVQRASRLKQLLDDPIIADALSRMERRFYEEFIAADSSEKRVTAWAKANVLKEFEREMNSVFDAGETEVLRAAKDAAKAASRTTERI